MDTQALFQSPGTAKDFILPDSKDTVSKIQQIFLAAGDAVLSDSSMHLSEEQRKLVRDIQRCRTIGCGFNLEVCDECGCRRVHYNSCGNRNCPICNGLKKELWVDARSSEVIDAPYYHIVFTAPHELNPLFLANRPALFALFHKAVGQTVIELAKDPRHLGATPGVIQVLHTWSQKLLFHPHVHAVVSGGGLTGDRKLKVLEKGSFFIAESILSAMFRGKFLDALEKLYRSGELRFPAGLASMENPADWDCFRDSLYRLKWVAHVKETFNGNGNAIEYLGRYANKVAITDSRILSVSEDAVTFTVRGADGKQSETETITPVEFVRRFLLHVLPKGFQKIRYYGYLNNSRRKNNLTLIFNLQGYRQFLQKYKGMDAAAIILEKWGHDIHACPSCNSHKMITIFSTRTKCTGG